MDLIQGMIAGEELFCGLFCAVTQAEDVRHKSAAIARTTTFPIYSPGGKNNMLCY